MIRDGRGTRVQPLPRSSQLEERADLPCTTRFQARYATLLDPMNDGHTGGRRCTLGIGRSGRKVAMSGHPSSGADSGAKRVVAVVLALLSAFLLALGTLLPSWWSNSDREQSFSLFTALGMFEDQSYASATNRFLGAVLPIGFIGLLLCTAVATVAALGAVVGRRSDRFLRVAQIVAGLLCVGALVPGGMTLIAFGGGAVRLGMAFYLPGVLGYAGLCFTSLNAAWAPRCPQRAGDMR